MKGEILMASLTSFNQILANVADLPKFEVKSRILHFHGRFPLDFTEQYLDTLPVEKLRHILAAAILTNRVK